ncbi:MAG: 16S rRNA (adenine(1518)-N(6)/adenine(1519)-N(6))-dimethyltransferase RsmA [Thermoproteota archaeon]
MPLSFISARNHDVVKGNSNYSHNAILEETIRMIREYGIRPKKRLSQSFVVDERLIKRLIQDIQPEPDDTIVEIGAGLGTLTLKLAKHGSKVKAVEIDGNLIKILKDRFSSFQNVEVIQGDFMEMDLEGNVYTGNIPYHISTPILFKILEHSYDRAVMTVQKEVAERIVSKPGSKRYGRLTVSINVKAEPRITGIFPPSSFYPRPKVFHAVLCLKPIRMVEDMAILDSLLRAMFSQRNRIARTVLKRALKTLYGKRGYQIYPSVVRFVPEGKRVFELKVEEFIQFVDVLKKTLIDMGA